MSYKLPMALAHLCALDHWVIWKREKRDDRFTKPPRQAARPEYYASTGDPATWSTYEKAAAAIERLGLHGIGGGLGFVVCDCEIAGLDLDKCVAEDGTIAWWALEIIRRSGSYAEISPSGTGVRIFGLTEKKDSVGFVLSAPGEGRIEVYRQSKRFLTVTGVQIDERSTLVVIDTLIEELKARSLEASPRAPDGRSTTSIGRGNEADSSSSGVFHKRVCSLTEHGWTVEAIETDMRAHPSKYEETKAATYEREGRLRQEIERSAGKAKKVTAEGEWPEPKPLPHGLAPVATFDIKFLPDALAPWVGDIAERLQCPPDYVGVSAVTGLGSVIGRRVGIKPQAKTDWIEYPNLWTAFIGQPGMLKSPAMLAALAPLHHLEAEAAKENQIAREAYEANLDAFKLRAQVKTSLAKAALKKGKEMAFELGGKPEEPVAIRFRTNDSTYESLGEILIGNPTGILIERDELVSLLQHLDREEQTMARGFYMSGWAGTQPYTFDRIIRGHLHIDAVCLSILGNTQPVRINRYVRRANLDGGGDGLIQRFGLLVWPDIPPLWHDVDQYPDSDARRKAWDVFERMSTLSEDAVRKLGARKGPFDKTPCFRFDEAAREQFADWRKRLELRLRSGELSAALEGHFAKYRKLVPALALINHLSDGGEGSIGLAALRKALAFSHYLESHALRVYGAADMVELAAGQAILNRIRAGELMDGFTARDVHQRNWSGLTERDWVQAGLDLLVDLDYLAATTDQHGERGGRPKTTYAINPRT